MSELNNGTWCRNPRTADKKMVQLDEAFSHRAEFAPDDGEPIRFKWHFQRGLLSPRMSGLELATFVLDHMRAIIGMGLLHKHQRVEAEFQAMFVKLSTSPKEVLDRLLSWIKVEYHESDDDVIYMSLFDKTPQKAGPVYFQ